MRIKTWNIERVTGYKPKTTFYEDFSIADRFGIPAVKDTYERAFSTWKENIIYLTELVMVLNWKIWEHCETNNALAVVYNDLWETLREYALDTLKDTELEYFLQTIDQRKDVKI